MDPKFAENCEPRGMLRQAKERVGITQEATARRFRAKKSAISLIENRAEDIRLFTLVKYAEAPDKNPGVQLTD